MRIALTKKLAIEMGENTDYKLLNNIKKGRDDFKYV
jgi:hypothetical protein